MSDCKMNVADRCAGKGEVKADKLLGRPQRQKPWWEGETHSRLGLFRKDRGMTYAD